MTFKPAFAASLVAATLLSAAAAQAGGPAGVAVEPAPVVAPVAAKAKPKLTFGFEVSPEYYATDKAGSYKKGDLASTVAKLSVSKALDNGFTVGGALAYTTREPGTTGMSSNYAQLEVNTSYKVKFGSAWSVTPSATLGYAFGDQPKVDPDDAKASEAYYAINVSADYKIGNGLTWNVINARYRDAFSGDWATPKVTTGLTYALDDVSSAYVNVGKSWKDSGDGMKNDKFSFAFGLKRAF